MRRALWIGAVALAVVAAIPVWLALEDGGRQAAALQEPTATGDIGRLILTGKNDGKPFPVRSFSVGAEFVQRPSTPPHVSYSGLELLRRFDDATISSFQLGTSETHAAGKLEIGTTKPYLIYTLTQAAVDALSTGHRGEVLRLAFSTLTADVLGGPPTAPAAEVIGRMTVPALSDQSYPITGFETGFQREVGHPSSGTVHFTERTHSPAMVRRAIDALAPEMFTAIAAQAPNPVSLGRISVELITPGTTVPYATYSFDGVLLDGVSDQGATGSYPTQQIKFVYDSVQLKTASGSASETTTLPK